MERRDNMPHWVFFGLSSINTRKGALILFWSCFMFGLACIPFSPALSWLPATGPGCFACGVVAIPASYHLDDWSWVGLTFIVALWYWLCIRWIDKNSTWEARPQ